MCKSPVKPGLACSCLPLLPKALSTQSRAASNRLGLSYVESLAAFPVRSQFGETGGSRLLLLRSEGLLLTRWTVLILHASPGLQKTVWNVDAFAEREVGLL